MGLFYMARRYLVVGEVMISEVVLMTWIGNLRLD